MDVASSSTMLKKATFSYLEDLNSEQRKAVEHTEGPLLVLAGAGTGKTRVLTTRISYILQCGFCRPYEILAVTFTNKAAQEMRERISHLMGNYAEGLWMGTFHSLAVRILRTHAEKIGFQPQFTIIDTDDQIRLLKQIIQAENLDEKQFPARSIAVAINRLKDKGITAEKAENYETGILVKIYKDYQERLNILNAVDFGDLLLHNLQLFKRFPEVLQHYQQQFKFIFVDEYQDTNSCQYLWLRLLAQQHQNICCVGDDDQSIYGWRGAEVANILRFEKDFVGAKVIRLEQNYRSTPAILQAASTLISYNRDRYKKTLWTQQEGGEPLRVQGTWSSQDESRFIADEIEARQRYGDSLNSIAVLVRAGFQTREFEDCFMRMGIPYRVIGGLRFYERLEIRDAIAYLRFVSQPDDGLAFERIINQPKRGIGDTTLRKLHQFAREQGISLPKAARFAAESILDNIPLKGAPRATLLQFFKEVDIWRQHSKTQSPAETLMQILDESGYTQIWMKDKSPEAAGRLENLKELVKALNDFQSIEGFLEHVSLVLDTHQANEHEMVTVMTLHAAKGLEFDTVFLAGWEEGIFPHARALDEQGEAGLEEERRLAYVGISRAKKRAFITYAYQRRAPQGFQKSKPSRFIDELPQKAIIHQNPYGHEKKEFEFSLSPTAKRALTPRPQSSLKPDFSPKIATHSFTKSEKIFHQKFGYGQILAIDGDTLTIEFEHSGEKRIIASFVEKA